MKNFVRDYMMLALKKIKSMFKNGKKITSKTVNQVAKEGNVEKTVLRRFSEQLQMFLQDQPDNRKNHRWSSIEEEFVLNYVLFLDASGQRIWGNKLAVFFDLAELLGRPVSGVRNRYYKLARIHKNNIQKEHEKMVSELQKYNQELVLENATLKERLIEVDNYVKKALA